jgi:hypothetical protein
METEWLCIGESSVGGLMTCVRSAVIVMRLSCIGESSA